VAQLRIQPLQRHDVGEARARDPEQLVEHARQGEQRRPGVEAEAVPLTHRQLSTHLGPAFEDRDAVAGRP
jgi:hypothetical protein